MLDLKIGFLKGKKMANFHESLESGKELENIILSQIKPKYHNSYIIDGYCKEYDIYIPEKEFGIEVKRDEKSKHTGNYVIEIEFDDKPSALSTTKAEYWVIFDGEYYVWIKTSRLKSIISMFGSGYLATFIGKGDDKYKKAYLMPKHFIKDNADLVKLGNINDLQSKDS